MKLIIKGRVQGVGFRYFVLKVAKKFDIMGWVRNKKDGNVEIAVNDQSQNIEKFINEIKKGNGYSNILSINKEKYFCEEKKFQIKY